jgi:tripartite-type tricarboxylate transporter receptor subunit TctC
MNHYPNRRTILGSLAAACLGAPAFAQARWPAREVTIFVPSAAGGAADFSARTLGNFITHVTPGAVVIIDDRAGAGGILGTLAAKQAPADGHHFLLSTNSTHAANVSLYAKLGYDPLKDFEPVGMLGKFGTVLMVRSDAPMKSLTDLIAFANAHPGKLSFGYYSSSSQVPAELLKSRAHIDAVAVSYKNITQIITDLLGGQLDFAFMDMLSASPALQNPRLRPIGVSAPRREPLLPNVPSVAEVLPGYELQGWIGVHAAAGTPNTAIERMAALMAQAVADEGVKKALESRGMIVAGMPPDQMREFVKQDIVRWAEWIKLAGIHPQ